jgi:hypothetical protein
VAAGADKLLHHLFWHLGGDLQRHPLKPVIKVIDGLGGDKLEQNGIPCVLPPKQHTENTQKPAVKDKHILPNGLAKAV